MARSGKASSQLYISIKYSESASPTCLNIDNCPVTDPSIISNSFNEYFASIAAKIREKIPEASKHFSSFLKNPVPNSIFLSPTDALEVSNCISSPHGIPPKILSLINKEISIPLSIIIKQSFSLGVFLTI